MDNIGGQGGVPPSEIPQEPKVEKENSSIVDESMMMGALQSLMRVPGKVPPPLNEKKLTQTKPEEPGHQAQVQKEVDKVSTNILGAAKPPPLSRQKGELFRPHDQIEVGQGGAVQDKEQPAAPAVPPQEQMDELDLLASTFDFSAGQFKEAQKSDPLNPITKKIESIVNTVVGHQMNDEADEDVSKMVLSNLKVISKTAPDLIRQGHQNLQEVKREITDLWHTSGRDRGEKLKALGTKQKAIEAQLTPLYASLTKLREALREDPEKAKLFDEAHRLLSETLDQKYLDITDAVQIPVTQVSKRVVVGDIIGNKSNRQKILQAAAKAVSGAKPKALKKLTKGDEAAGETASNNAKAIAVNAFAAIAVDYGRNLFGADLVAASRNIPTTMVIMNQGDVQRSNLLKDRIENSNLRLPGSKEKVPEIRVVNDHLTDGVCAGTSIELLIQHRKGGKRFVDIAAGFARGVSADAHANQTCYERLVVPSTTTLYDNLRVNQLPHVFDAKKGQGIFKADNGNINMAYNAVITGGGNTMTPLSSAITEVLKEQPQLRKALKGNPTFFQVTHSVNFKKAVLEKLKSESVEVTEQLKNELDWVIALNELYGATYVYSDLIDSSDLVSAKGSFKNDFENFFSNPEIGKTLWKLVADETDFAKLQLVIRSRGADLKPLGSEIGLSFAMKNDAEALDRASQLPDGHYMVGITLNKCGHALCYFKGKDEAGKQVEYLYDPNFGTIDCSGGRLKEQFTRLLTFQYYPTADKKEQGVLSDGTSHQIQFHRIIDAPDYKDLLE